VRIYTSTPAAGVSALAPGRDLVLDVPEAQGLALAAGVGLAAAYALGMYLRTYWLSVEAMVRWHGRLNAFGFALPGLLAWSFPANTPPDGRRKE
jgi:hypothetical protein